MVDFIYNNVWLINKSEGERLLTSYENYVKNGKSLSLNLNLNGSEVKINNIQEDEVWQPKIENGIGIIPITGLIVRYGNQLNPACGLTGTATGMLHNKIQEYINNSNVKAILLNIDSNGGDGRGISDLAEIINKGSKVKPIYSFVNGYCASAAYWLASASEKIIASKSAYIGSIGAVAAYRKKDEEDEYKEFVSSQSPNKRLDIETDEGASEMQTYVDDAANVFIEAVGNYRNMSSEEVVKAGNKGGILIASKALKNKLIDGIGTIDTVMNELTNEFSKENFIMEKKADEVVKAVSNELDAVKPNVANEISKVSNQVDMSKISNSSDTLQFTAEQSQYIQELLENRTKELENRIKMNEFALLAEKKYPNMSGTSEFKGSLLMAVESMQSEHKNYILGLMDKMETQTSVMTETVTNNVPEVKEDFNEKIEARAKEIMNTSNISFARAKLQALEEMEGE